MMSYYDERAEEYDEIYLGKGHATIDPDAYRKDVAKVSEMVSRFGKGHLIDIACGAGFWLPHYALNCSQITFLDQSARMLSKCKDRVEELGLADVSSFIQGDFKLFFIHKLLFNFKNGVRKLCHFHIMQSG